MNSQLSESFADRWFTFSLAEQLGNVGSEIERYKKWQIKEQPELAMKAFYRGLELLNLTFLDARHGPNKRREIGRLKEVLCDTVLNHSELYDTPIEFFEKYFMQFALVAQKLKHGAYN